MLGRVVKGALAGPLCALSAAALLWVVLPSNVPSHGEAGKAQGAESLRVAVFRVDATPPIGSPVAYAPARKIEDPLSARGIVLLGADKPIVLCAVDWIGIGNGGHDTWREKLAAAAGTTPDRVAVHALHQHDGPQCDFTAEALLEAQGLGGKWSDAVFARQTIERVCDGIREAIDEAQPITHLGVGIGTIEKVASNRRILGDDGKVAIVRWSKTTDPAAIAAPEGVIDPRVRIISFWNGERPIACLSYYATHPQSYYGRGDVTPDFIGLARAERERALDDLPLIHFNGAGGNVTAGKYNNGSHEARVELTRRVAAGMKQAWENTRRAPLQASDVTWRVAPAKLPVAEHLDAQALAQQVADKTAPLQTRGWAASALAFKQRCDAGEAIDISCLRMKNVHIMHMPGELFIEYQLAAQAMRPNDTVCMAAYGDYGPFYIGTKIAYEQGGYETQPTSSLVAPGVEQVLTEAMQELLAEETADSPDKDYAAELPRIPPKSPEEALQQLQIEPGFRVEQVAAEPLVTDPVAAAFDERGRLFVVEMLGYSENRDDVLGRVRILEDTDHDGKFDRSTVFADDLPWPTAVICYDGGAFVAAAPNVHYFKDTDGDGRADESKIVFTGFGVGNVQGLVNSFNWGLDNRIHGATSSNGGAIVSPLHPERKPVALSGRDFAFDPRTLELSATAGGGQHGASFDRWGNRFVCSNSDHIQVIAYDDRYIARNPLLRAPGPRISIAAEGPAAPVFRISPVEPWRIVRTRLRVSGIAPGIVEGNGAAAGYFTGATGATIYRGNAFPESHRHGAFVGDAGGNLVHRKVLERNGLDWTARRVEQGREFLASKDIWFRPVQFLNAPDGALYVLDMSREVIEHPHSIPPFIKKHLDLTSGRDQGRIYRVVPENFRQPPPVDFTALGAAELAALLEHENGWHRDTALRLIYERQPREAVSHLERLAANAKLAEGRIAALCALSGLAALSPETVLARLSDEHPRVREHAVRLSEKLAEQSPTIRERLYAMAHDDDAAVRYQLAFTLGELEDPRRLDALAALALRDGNHGLMQLAIQSSLAAGAGKVVGILAADERFGERAESRRFLEQLAQQVGRQQHPADVAELARCVERLAAERPAAVQAIVSGIALGAGKNAKIVEQLSAASGGKSEELLRELVAQSKKLADRDDENPAARAEAIRALRLAPFPDMRESFIDWLSPRHPREVQLAALETLGQLNEPEVAEILLANFNSLSPRLRGEALEAIFSRPAWIAALLGALETEDFSRADVDAPRVKKLLEHAEPSIRARAETIFGAMAASPRGEVLAAYERALELAGEAERGRQVFRRVCAGCHRLEGHGHEIGPQLAAMRNRGREAMLTNVLDPNREVDPKYVSFSVISQDGRAFSGMIESETATSITLKRAENATDTILRIDIEELRGTGQSIMPEGLERQIDRQEMADLLEYLMTVE